MAQLQQLLQQLWDAIPSSDDDEEPESEVQLYIHSSVVLLILLLIYCYTQKVANVEMAQQLSYSDIVASFNEPEDAGMHHRGRQTTTLRY